MCAPAHVWYFEKINLGILFIIIMEYYVEYYYA